MRHIQVEVCSKAYSHSSAVCVAIAGHNTTGKVLGIVYQLRGAEIEGKVDNLLEIVYLPALTYFHSPACYVVENVEENKPGIARVKLIGRC